MSSADKDKEIQEGNASWFEQDGYRIKAEGYDIQEATEESTNGVNASGEPFESVEVNWNTDNEGSTDASFQEHYGITWWKIAKAPWYSPFTWELTVNVRDTYHYIFADETNTSGGMYHLDCFKTGIHTVQYRSDKPKIHKVSGS